MAMQVGRSIHRSLVNKFSFPAKYCLRCYSSAPQPRTKGLSRPAYIAYRTVLNVTGVTLMALWTYKFDAYGSRTAYQKWRAEKRAKALLQRLDGKEYETMEAYLEMLEREANALKSELLKRESDVLKPYIHEREIAVLKERIFSREFAALKDEISSRGNEAAHRLQGAGHTKLAA